MKAETLKILYTYAIASFIVVGTYYALVIYPYVLDSDVKLWLTGASGGALAFVFGDQIASRTKTEQQSAFNAALYATPPATFTCTFDAMSFMSQADLDRHMLVHEGQE
jgi:hypothetical protein